MKSQTKLLLAVLWILLTLPMVFLGFGSDLDSWRVAQTAEKIWLTGAYHSSRSTGFPLHELMVTPLVHWGQWYLSNSLSLAFGLLILWLLFKMADQDTFRHPALYVISFIFFPIFQKNSASTMDYVPALALMLAAYASMRKEKWLVAALLTGLAAGFRPTSALFVLPLTFYLWQRKQNLLTIVKFVSVAAITGFVSFIPFLVTYRTLFVPHSFFKSDWIIHSITGWYHFLAFMGIIPSIGVYGFLLLRFYQKRRSALLVDPEITFHVVNILLWLALFIFLPEEPEYLLPMLPSILFLIDRCVGEKEFFFLAMLLLSYHFVRLDLVGGEPGRRQVAISLNDGYTIQDIQDRRFKMFLREVVSHYRALQPTVLMLGKEWIPVNNDRWEYDAGLEMVRQKAGLVLLSGRINDEKRLQQLKNQGYLLLAWRGEMWEYHRSENAFYQNYVTVIDDLGAFFAVSIVGKALNLR